MIGGRGLDVRLRPVNGRQRPRPMIRNERFRDQAQGEQLFIRRQPGISRRGLQGPQGQADDEPCGSQAECGGQQGRRQPRFTEPLPPRRLPDEPGQQQGQQDEQTGHDADLHQP